MARQARNARVTDWQRYGTGCRICGAAPRTPCLGTRICIDEEPYAPVQRPHRGRRVTERKPYPREAAIRAAHQRLVNQGKRGTQ